MRVSSFFHRFVNIVAKQLNVPALLFISLSTCSKLEVLKQFKLINHSLSDWRCAYEKIGLLSAADIVGESGLSE